MGSDSSGTAVSADEHARELRTRRISEFVYGIVTAMIATAGFLEQPSDFHPLEATAGILAGAVAIWVTHAYSHLIGRRVYAGRPFGATEALHELRASWPVVTAGAFVAVPSLLAITGIWDLRSGLVIGDAVALSALTTLGLAAGRLGGEGWLRSLRIAGATVAIGLFVVIVELVVHVL